MKRNLILVIAIALLLAMVVTVSVACTPRDDLPKDDQSSGSTSSGSTSGDNTSGGGTSGEDRPITEKWEEKFAVSYRVDVLTQEELDSLSKEMELDLVYLMQYCDKDDDGRHPIGWISIFGNETDAEEYYDIQVEELEYDSDSEIVVRREGKVVFLGTADGLKIFMEV